MQCVWITVVRCCAPNLVRSFCPFCDATVRPAFTQNCDNSCTSKYISCESDEREVTEKRDVSLHTGWYRQHCSLVVSSVLDGYCTASTAGNLGDINCHYYCPNLELFCVYFARHVPQCFRAWQKSRALGHAVWQLIPRKNHLPQVYYLLLSCPAQ